MKAIERYFPVALFIMLYKVVLTFESIDETLAPFGWKLCRERYFSRLILLCRRDEEERVNCLFCFSVVGPGHVGVCSSPSDIRRKCIFPGGH